MFLPLFPIYVSSFGISITDLGLVVASFAIATVIFQVPFGAVSDHLGRKPMIVIALLGYAVTSFLYALSTNTIEFVTFRFLQGTASAAMWSPAEALILDSSDPKQRGLGMGFYQTSFNAGLIAGPIIGGLIATLQGVRMPFYFAAALALVAAALALVLLKEPPRTVKGEKSHIFNPLKGLIEMPVEIRSAILILALANLFEIIGYGIFEPIFPLYASKEFGASPTLIGLVFSVGSIGLVIGPSPMGRLGDKYGQKPLIVGGLVVISLFVAAYAWVFDVVSLVILMIPVSLGTSAFLTALPTLVGNLAPVEKRALVLGAVNTAGNLGLVIGPIIAGFAWDMFGSRIPFYIDSLSVALGAVLVYLKVTGRRTIREEKT